MMDPFLPLYHWIYSVAGHFQTKLWAEKLVSLLCLLGPSRLMADYLSTSYDGIRMSTGYWERQIRILLASVLRWKRSKSSNLLASVIMMNLGYKSYDKPDLWKNFVNKERHNVNMNDPRVLLDVTEMIVGVNDLLITTKRSMASPPSAPQLRPLSSPSSSPPPLDLPPSVLSSTTTSSLASPRDNSDITRLGSNNMYENKKAANLGQNSSVIEQ